MEARDLDALAALHRMCLPRSLVGTLGLGYVRAFYRYVSRSSRELLIVDRDDRGTIIAAAVVTLDPGTLVRRLALHTPLAARAIAGSPRLMRTWLRARRAGRRAPDAGQTHTPSNVPELILIFTSPAERGQGRASALIAEAERRLREKGVTRYEVSTEAEGQNPALQLYERRGFEPIHTTLRLGTRFQVFTRTLYSR